MIFKRHVITRNDLVSKSVLLITNVVSLVKLDVNLFNPVTLIILTLSYSLGEVIDTWYDVNLGNEIPSHIHLNGSMDFKT